MELIEPDNAQADTLQSDRAPRGGAGAPPGQDVLPGEAPPRERDRSFGFILSRIIAGEALDFGAAREAFRDILCSRVSEMNQGAFLGALATRGETVEELAAAWEAIYELDTVKPLEEESPEFRHAFPAGEIVENCGTGMDSFKTFNISTAASLVAAACGVPLARHGARSITSRCGTVDIAEALGVDPDAPPPMVLRSITTAGIGLFNGMSPAVHPRALGRILSQISFGSCLNIAASLCNPLLPTRGVRGVYAPEMVVPVAELMRRIGYRRGLVFYGGIDNSSRGMDEASVCGTTQCAAFDEGGSLHTSSFRPGDAGLAVHDPRELAAADDISLEAVRFVRTLRGLDAPARVDAVLLNAACLLRTAGKVDDLPAGVALARDSVESGAAFDRLEAWVAAQNRDPRQGRDRLLGIRAMAGIPGEGAS